MTLCVSMVSFATADGNFFNTPEKQKKPDPEEQRPITILDLVHDYDLDPHTASYSSEAQILCGLYEGLFSYDPATLDPLPAIATSYKVSRDKKKWTFTIGDNITFSNGDPITAQTIKDSWISLLGNQYASFASLLDCIKGAADYRTGKGSSEDVAIEVKDEHTLIVQLTQPTEHFARILCHVAFSAVSSKPGVYSGAFILDSYKDGKLVMKKNPLYRDAANVFIPEITVVQSDDQAENAYKFNSGEVDWISSGVDTKKLLNQDAIHINAEFATTYFFFKGQNAPWNDADMRNALLQAVPWTELRKGYLVPATTLVYPLGNYPDVTGLTDTDADDALDKMNYAREKLGIPKDQKIPLVFAITDSDYMKEQAELLKKAWEPLGVELTTQSTPASRYNEAIEGWNADLFAYTWIGDFADPLAFLELFRGGSSLNVSKYNSSRYNKLLESAAEAEDAAAHSKLLAQAEQCLLDDSVIIPISHPVSVQVIDMTLIGGWTTNALDLHPLRYLYIKHKETTLPNLVMK